MSISDSRKTNHRLLALSAFFSERKILIYSVKPAMKFGNFLIGFTLIELF